MTMQTKEQNLELILLGGFELYCNGHPLNDAVYGTMRALLAYLVMEPQREHSREALASMLWDTQELTTARGNLRRTLSDLRRVLEAPSGRTLFVAGKQTLGILPDFYVDVHAFSADLPACVEEMERLIRLYRGEFMQGVALPASPVFEEWLLLQREVLRHRALVLLERISNYHEQRGSYTKALPFALRYTELEPLNESGQCQVMRLYVLAGQPDAANRQYQSCCQLLKTELGVLPSEATRELVRQIRQGRTLHANRQRTAGEPPAIVLSPPVTGRRQVTVLYCELASAIGWDDDDPDEMLERLHAPQARCLEIIRQYSGYLMQTHGGGLLVYFGYPQATEDAARRAVLAALAIKREVTGGIEACVGVHTGLVITSKDAGLPDTVGKTSRIAIQLHHALAGHGVTISQATHEIVKGYFACRNLGVQRLPGLKQGITLFEVLEESGARSRLEASAQLTPLCGRTVEISSLMGLWQETTRGRCPTVLLQGEAGIGKSRLLHALKERLRGEPHEVRELRCFPEYTHSVFYPLRTMLEEVLGFSQSDTAEHKSLQLAAYFESRYPSLAAETVPLLCQLLALPQVEAYPSTTLSSQQFKARAGDILFKLVHTLSSRQPLLLIVEDLHWADPSTLALLQRHIEQAGTSSVLTLLTARPGFIPPWRQCDAISLFLPPLSQAEATAMISAIDTDIAPDIVRHIVKRSDGIPLYAEEMVRYAARENAGAIPATLHDLLAARIDRVGAAKQIAQLAATIGREFSVALLRKLQAGVDVSNSLDSLCDAGLIFTLNSTNYQFKHTLIQEAAYQSQTRRKRQATHRHIAEILLVEFPDVVSTQPEVIAQHYYHGGETLPAVEYWIKAGRRALLNAAPIEALEHLQAGQRALSGLPRSAERDQFDFTLNLHLGSAWTIANGYGAEESKAAYARALKLGDEEDSAALFAALYGLWVSEHAHGGNSLALEVAEQLLQLAQDTGNAVQRQVAHQCMGSSTGTIGNLPLARHHFEQVLSLYRPAHHHLMMSQYSDNIRINSGVQLAMVLWLQGYPDQALFEAEVTLSLARTERNPHVLCFALYGVAVIRRWRNQPEASGRFAAECLAVAEEFELPFWLLLGSTAYAWAKAFQGQSGGMDALLVQLQRDDDATPAGIRLLVLHQLGEGLVYLQRIDEALKVLNEAIMLANRLRERYIESEYHRLKGACLMNFGDKTGAEACFERALAISRNQGAKSMELRAAISIAQLWQEQGKYGDALAILGGIYSKFSEGFDTPNLSKAATLIHELQAIVNINAHPRRNGRKPCS